MPLKNLIVLAVGLLATSVLLEAKPRTVTVDHEHKFAVEVPDGFTFTSERTAGGGLDARITAPDDETYVHLTFVLVSDPESGEEEWQQERLSRMFVEAHEQSVEQAFNFKPLESKSGGGIQVTFTDRKLVGLSLQPPDDFVYMTAGLKSWPGCVMVFQLMSNDKDSPEYAELLRLVRESCVRL